jgi:SSS family solute:Na+ symporter
MISSYDCLNIVFYLLFIAGVSVCFARRSKNTSDYFRAGGVLPWWVTGASTWMASFSAWTFTGAAGKMYESGPYAVGLYYSAIIPLLILLFFTSHRFRRMQVVTPFEAVRLRFGQGSQVFFTWARLPFILIFGGVSLNAVALFMAAVFNVDTWVVILIMGFVITMLSLLGGAFGVAANDFVQMFLVVTVTVTVAVLALALPDIGGVRGMLEKAPERHYDWGDMARPQFIVLWLVGLVLTKCFEENSMDKSSKYLMSRSDRHARLTLIIPLLGMSVAPLLWLVPPTVAAIRHPDMASLFPKMKFPEEAAFLVTAADVLPQGMLGLLLCGICAATLTGMDAALNQGAGIFVRSFYLPILNPGCSERKLLVISKISTGVFGLVVMSSALLWDNFRNLGLFDLVNQLAISLGLPMAIPLCFGLFWRRTPPWAAWSTVLVGMCTSFIVKFVLKPEMFSALPGMGGPFKVEEVTQFYVFGTVMLVGGVCTAWFFGTTLFYRSSPEAYRKQLDDFFDRLKTPVDAAASEEKREDQAIGGSIGKLCVVYGTFVAALSAIPNPPWGRLCFVACGGVMIGIGGIVWIASRTRRPPLLSGSKRDGPHV